jgi:hypothetical protein
MKEPFAQLGARICEALSPSRREQIVAPSFAKGSKRKQRRSFFLLETLVASSLTLIVVIGCLSVFVLMWRASIRQQDHLKQESLRWRRVSTLRWTLSRIRRECKEDPFVLEGTGPLARLVFVFDHGVHIDPKLANNDLGQLYIDEKKGLVLVTRSHPKRGVIGQEEEQASVIWPNAKSISWRFAMCQKDIANKPGAEESLQDQWAPLWRPDWPGLPAVIQASIRDEDDVETVVTAILVQDIGVITLK